MAASDNGQLIREQVVAAFERKMKLRIMSGGTKAFYGRTTYGEPLDMRQHRGIVNYDPTELVLTVRSGTTLTEIETALDAQEQMLPFEPPHFGQQASIGGTIATGLAGPRRPYSSSVRDCVLGCQLINGKGEYLHFGGQVMKNVAGYDVSRLVTGSMGTLGVMLQFSIKVLPKPAGCITLIQKHSAEEALHMMNRIKGNPLPVDASCYHEGNLYIRLSGSIAALESAHNQLGGDLYNEGEQFWHQLREHELAFFTAAKTLWRLSVKPSTPKLALDGQQLIDWGGAQRWLASEEPEQKIRAVVAEAGGHATLFRGGDRTGEIFHPLSPALMVIHQNLKKAFDPGAICNPGAMYANL
ncbi:MAG: glycolate oxidase subunit GlcE [Gammaproteobacteria bacterium]|nr:glycolate oxidase subunit GlcE [Gammaproteobacteria bacterium]